MNTITARIGGMPLNVPVCIDDATTQAVIDGVNQRLRDIEAASSRVNTQAFALQAAYAFAADLERAERRQSTDTEAIVEALDSLLSKFTVLYGKHPES